MRAIRWPSARRPAPRDLIAAAGVLATAVTAVALAIAFVRVGILHRAPSAARASATWGVLLLASFCGYGSALERWISPRRRADWGLRCAWGWAAAVAGGGALCAIGLARAGVLVALTGLGVALLGVELVRGCRRWMRRSTVRWARVAWGRLPFGIGAAAVFALGAVAYLASIVNGDFNGNDDRLCYFGFAREILERGTLSQPFSMRRVSAYGGKDLLDAMQLAIPVPDTHLHLLDSGMALITVMALILGFARRSRASRAVVLLLLLLTATLPEIRINTATTMTGVVFFLGLYRTLVWKAGAPPASSAWRRAVPVAMLAAGACTLRQNYLVPAGVVLILEYGRPIARSLRLRPFRVDRAPVVEAAQTAALVALFLAPWWGMALRWCGTFLFPFVRGNFNPGYLFFQPLTRFEKLHYVWANACYCLPLKAVPLLLVAWLAARRAARPPALASFAIAAFVGFALLVQAYPDSDPPNMGRYYFGFTFAALLAIALETTAGGRADGRGRTESVAALALVVAALALQIYGDRDATMHTFDKALTAIEPDLEDPGGWAPRQPDANYKKLQDAIPEGAPIAVMVDEFGNFDFRRNPIESLDMVGAISPSPGLPLHEGPDAVADYLASLGYRYAIVVRPDAAGYLYRRDTWVRNAANGDPVWKRSAGHYLAAFEDFDALRKSRVHLAEAGPMTALDLTRSQLNP